MKKCCAGTAPLDREGIGDLWRPARLGASEVPGAAPMLDAKQVTCSAQEPARGLFAAGRASCAGILAGLKSCDDLAAR